MEAGMIRNNLHYSAASCVGNVKGDGVYEVSGHLVAGTCPYDWGHTSLGGGDSEPSVSWIPHRERESMGCFYA